MYISKLTIRNYRNFSNASFHFNKGINTLIGENGSGKTNVFNALRILLDENLPRYSKKLSESDFNKYIEDWRFHWIVISIEFSELSSDDKIQCLATHYLGTPNAKGNFNFYYRPKETIRQKLFEFSQLPIEKKTKENFNKFKQSISIDDYEPIFTSKAQNIDFADNDFYKKHVGDFENFIFPDPSEKNIDELGIFSKSFSIYDEISCTYADALRDVVTDLKKYRSSPLIALLNEYESALDDVEKEEVERLVKQLNKKISSLEKVEELSNEIIDTIHNTVGQTYSPNVKIQSSLPNETKELFKKLTIQVGETLGEELRDIELLSLGGANLIYLSLKLLSYSMNLPKYKSAYLLFIEEPETHLHTHVQKTIFHNIGKDKAQVIYSTHSTHISEVCNISSVNVLSKKTNYSKVFQPTNGLSSTEITHLERYLDATRNTLLFAKAVILVEGDAESFLIPAMIKMIFGISVDELGLSIINVGSTSFKNIAIIFDEQRIQKKCSIITDEDKSLSGVENDSEKEGLRRKSELIEFSKKNDFIDLFFAQYTFEVEIVHSGNKKYIEQVIDNIYKSDHHKSQEAKINSLNSIRNNNVSIYGEEILRLAKKEGKGWFAIQLIEYVDYKFTIPDYILKAIAFVCKPLHPSIIKNMAQHRIKLGKADCQSDDQAKFQELFSIIKNENLIEKYRNKLPKDPLTKLLSYL